MLKQSRRQQGTYTVIGLMLFLGFLIPFFTIISNLAVVTNASTQAHGIAYNLAFASANRGIDFDATKTAGAPVMLRESSDGVSVNTENDNIQKINEAYSDINNMKTAIFKASSLSNDNQETNLSVVQAPAIPLYTGSKTTGSPAGITDRPAGLASLSFDPYQNLFWSTVSQGQAPNAQQASCGTAPPTPYEPGVRLLNPNSPTGSFGCWTDDRAYGHNSAGDLSWSHYSSGAQVQVRAKRTLAFGVPWSTTQTGVASFGRPCDAIDINNGDCRY